MFIVADNLESVKSVIPELKFPRVDILHKIKCEAEKNILFRFYFMHIPVYACVIYIYIYIYIYI